MSKVYKYSVFLTQEETADLRLDIACQNWESALSHPAISRLLDVVRDERWEEEVEITDE